MKLAQKGLTRTKGVTNPRSEEWAGVWAGKEVKVEVRVRGGAAKWGSELTHKTAMLHVRLYLILI